MKEGAIRVKCCFWDVKILEKLGTLMRLSAKRLGKIQTSIVMQYALGKKRSKFGLPYRESIWKAVQSSSSDD